MKLSKNVSMTATLKTHKGFQLYSLLYFNKHISKQPHRHGKAPIYSWLERLSIVKSGEQHSAEKTHLEEKSIRCFFYPIYMAKKNPKNLWKKFKNTL